MKHDEQKAGPFTGEGPPTEKSAAHRRATKPLRKLWTALPWLIASLFGIALAAEHFRPATEVVIDLTQSTPPLKSASPYIQLQFRTLLQDISQKKQMIEQSRSVIANHQKNIERLQVDLELAGNTLGKLRAEYDPATLDGTSIKCGRASHPATECLLY